MKKLNYLLLGLAGLTLASCSQDDILNGSADGNYVIQVSLPSDVATRASIGDDATAAQTLYYAVYDMDGNFVQQDEADFAGATTLTLPLELASGASFQIAFFAQSPESVTQKVYEFDATAKTITVNYENMKSEENNADYYDCFYKLFNTGVIGSDAMQTQAILSRPVAQINWGTSDYDKASVVNSFGDDLADLKATLKVNVPNTLNMLDQTTTGDDLVTFPAFTPNNGTGADTYPVGGYEYVAMQYVLVPAEQTIQTLTLDVTNTTGSTNNTITVDNAPLQANYRTNIYGNLLTDNINFQVVLSDDWGTPSYTVADDFAALQKALNYSTPGSVIYLNNDMDIPSGIFITKEAELNLNGHTLTYSGATDKAPFLVNGSNANLTISGEGTITTTTESPLVWIYGGGTVNIKGGTFVDAYSHCVYIGGRNSSGGTANISGGSFKTSPADTWALNIYDGDRSSSSFNVTGGMFYEFDPSDNAAEGNNTNFVNSDYQSVATTIDGATWYVVVPTGEAGETVKIVTNSTDLATAIGDNDGATIYLTPGSYSTPNNFDGNVTIKGLDSENTVLIATMKYWQANGDISLSDLTVKQFPQNGMSAGFEGATSGTFNNVTFECEFHAMTGNNTFTNCTFSYDPQYYGTSGRYNLWIESRTDGTTTVTDCQFNNQLSKGILVYDNSSSADNLSTMGNITITNCTLTSAEAYKGNAAVEIHSENFRSAGTLTLTNCSYSGGYTALWQEKNNGTSEPTHFYTVIVNGKEVQEGGQTAGN